MNNKKDILAVRKYLNLQVLVMIIISYSIGTGFVSYLGRDINQKYFWLGLSIVLFFFLAAEFLNNYFLQTELFTIHKNREELIRKNNFFILYVVSITLVTLFFFLIFKEFKFNVPLIIFLLVFLLFLVLYGVPPFRWAKRGYSDFLITFLVVAITPIFALLLQFQEIHSTLFLLTYPAFFLVISYFLAQSLESYAGDMKAKKKTIMTNLGWKTGMNLHNMFILITYVLYGAAAIFGLPSILVLPALFSFPVALIQLWEMWRIGEGYKPRWNLLKISSMGSLGILAYFLLFNLWLR